MIHFLRTNFLTLTFFSFIFSISIPLDIDDKNWNLLQDGDIHISWKKHDGFPFCKAIMEYKHPSKNIKKLLEDKKNYSHIFERIEYSQPITNDIVHIKLDMPFPFSGRDYIVKYVYKKINDSELFLFKATEEVKIKIDKDYVRLIHAAGAWIITPIDNNTTQLTYIWNGELLGDFPNWALDKAWIEQGNEVLTWLKDALEK